MVRGADTRPSTKQGESFNETGDPFKEDFTLMQADGLKESEENLIHDINRGIVGLTDAHPTACSSKEDNFTFRLVVELYKNEPKIFKSSKFFPFTGHQLVVTSINFEQFIFPGTLSSNLIDSSQLKFFLRRDPQSSSLSFVEARNVGFPGFSLKTVVCLTSESSAHFTVVLFPMDKVSLLSKYPMAEDPNFPGLQFDEGECKLVLSQSDIHMNADWGQPILQVLISSFSKDSKVPLGKDPCAHCAGLATLLGMARKTEIQKNLDLLYVRWGEVEDQGARALKAAGWGTEGGSYI